MINKKHMEKKKREWLHRIALCAMSFTTGVMATLAVMSVLPHKTEAIEKETVSAPATDTITVEFVNAPSELTTRLEATILQRIGDNSYSIDLNGKKSVIYIADEYMDQMRVLTGYTLILEADINNPTFQDSRMATAFIPVFDVENALKRLNNGQIVCEQEFATLVVNNNERVITTQLSIVDVFDFTGRGEILSFELTERDDLEMGDYE